jgi:ketosteroid isomerase-like protein
MSSKETHEVNANEANHREQILQHIHSIFQAYLRKDREAIRRTHTGDWVGFQGPSVKIERGIDAYMANAEKSLQNLQGTGYELLDTEVQIYGDIALVYYVARYDYCDLDGSPGSIPLRSVDVYRRENGEWNQAGSHITVIPGGGGWGEGDQAKTPETQN